MQASDLDRVLAIYGQGLETGLATFETKVPSKENWHQSHHSTLRFVVESSNQVEGWIALSPVSNRDVYCGVGEVSIYISAAARGKKFGKELMEKMILESEKEGYWTLQSSIFQKNQASISLHSKVGFRVVGTRERIAQRDGKWHNTVIMERRSNIL